MHRPELHGIDLCQKQGTNQSCIALQAAELFTEASRWAEVPKHHWKWLEIKQFEKQSVLKTSSNS